MKPESSLSARLGILAVLLAAIAALAIPAAASAQDPAGDQYAPSSPNGGGDYNFGPTGSANPAPQSGAGSNSGGNGPSGTDPAVPTAPQGSADGSTDDGSGGGGGGGGGGHQGNRDQRTVDQLGADGQRTRDGGPALNGSADARLASSDADTSAGLGTILWVLIGAALIWAVILGVLNFRRRDAGSGTAGRRGDGHQPA